MRDPERLFERHAGVGAHPGLGEVRRPTLADANRTGFSELATLLAGERAWGTVQVKPYTNGPMP